MKNESEGDTNCKWCTGSGKQRLGKGAGRAGSQRSTRILRRA